jgi:hypothetical protein
MGNFKEWASDMSRAELLKGKVFPGNVAVLEVYKEDVQSESKADIVIGFNEGRPVTTSTKVEALIKPVAKVLAVGNDVSDAFKGLKVGSIVRIPGSVQNTIHNPEYLTLLQVQRGNQEPKLPKGMTKTTTKFSQYWREWLFQIDPFAEMTPVDSVTFLVPLSSATVNAYEA